METEELRARLNNIEIKINNLNTNVEYVMSVLEEDIPESEGEDESESYEETIINRLNEKGETHGETKGSRAKHPEE